MDSNGIHSYMEYEAANPLPDLGDILLSNETFCGVDLGSSQKTQNQINTVELTNHGQVEQSANSELYASLLNANRRDASFGGLEAIGVGYPSHEDPRASIFPAHVQPQEGSTCNDSSDTRAEEEFLYQLNLSKCDKFPLETPKRKPNTRNLAKLKCAKLNGVKTVPSKQNDKPPKSKYVTLKEKISRLKAANQRQRNLSKNIISRTKPRSNKLTAPEVERTVLKIKPLLKDDSNNDSVSGMCRICHFAFASKDERTKHFNDPSHIIKVEAKKGTNFQALKEEAKVFTDVVFPAKCSICGELLHKRREFLVHHRRHAGMRPFRCVLCSSSFFRRCDLLSHLRNHLGANLTFTCDLCPASFSKQAALTSHLIAKHNRDDDRPRNYKCTECSVAFMSKNAVNRHMRAHTGYSAVTCPICGRGFSSNFALASHQRVHSGEMPFKCDACPYVSKTKQLLLRHKRSHNGEKPFKCGMCSYVSTSTSGLNRHMLKHSGVKPFKCPYCEYRSSNIENLRKHIKKTKKHVGLKIYPCQNCAFSCDDSAEFIRHVKQQHFPYLDEDSASATKLSGISSLESDQQPSVIVTSSCASVPANQGAPVSSVQSSLDSINESATIEMLIMDGRGDLFSQPPDDVMQIPGVNDLDNLSSPVIGGIHGLGQEATNPENLGILSSVEQDLPATAVSGLDEMLLNTLIKIPNLKKVILPQGDGNAPVTLVIGSDRISSENIPEDEDDVSPPNEDNMILPNPEFQTTSVDGFSTSSTPPSGHQHYIISSSGIQSYQKE